MSFISTAHAMAPQAGGGAAEPNLLTSFAPFILIFVVFYFLLIRPQQKKAKMHREMLSALKKGDYVITAAGFYGRIVETNGDMVVVDLGETTVTMARGYISGVPAANQIPTLKESTKKSTKAKPAKASSARSAKAQPEEEAPEAPEAQETSVVESAGSQSKDDDPVVK